MIVPLQTTSRAVVATVERKWRISVMENLKELVALPVGWDGYTAPPVSFSTAEFALRMMEVICGSDCPAPQIVPGSGGDLQLEWHILSGSIELHVKAPNNVLAWRTGFGLPDQSLDLTVDFFQVVDWLKLLPGCSSAATSAAA